MKKTPFLMCMMLLVFIMVSVVHNSDDEHIDVIDINTKIMFIDNVSA